MAGGVHFLDARAPEGMRLYAVGDVHGRHDLLAAMHGRIVEEILRDQPADWRLIYLGDYEDRGPDSRGVIEFLSRICAEDDRVIALAGNHDIGFMDFLKSPDIDGVFINNGGAETAGSYGVRLDLASRRAFHAGHAALVQAVPQDHLDFLENLPLSVTFGDFFFCHAGIRPGIPLESQKRDDLIWIRSVFHHHAGLHPKVIVHGHTPVDAPEIMANRVNLDTGGWFSNTLTALAVEGEEKRIFQVSA